MPLPVLQAGLFSGFEGSVFGVLNALAKGWARVRQHPPEPMNSVRDIPGQAWDGLPHSEIQGSTIARISPWLFAACHVLHRLSVPRHPPDALAHSLDRKTRRLQGQAPQTNKLA